LQGTRRDPRKTDGIAPRYRGRFAPSPSGPLHFGSLVAAVGSYLQARSVEGIWLVRIDDVDTPRTVNGASDNILHTLEALKLFWDNDVIYQSRRAANYKDALDSLSASQITFNCACTRKELAGRVYPGTCRNGVPTNKQARSVRVAVDAGVISFHDKVQGHHAQNLSRDVGDFVIRRGDGEIAYHLATVVDDAFDGITEIVRGSDLLDSTPRQILLQRLLHLPTPVYAHLPIAVNGAGAKLSKQNHAPALDSKNLASSAFRALQFLGQSPPRDLLGERPDVLWTWGVDNWRVKSVPSKKEILETARL